MWEGWGGGTSVTDAIFPVKDTEPKIQLAVPHVFPHPPPPSRALMGLRRREVKSRVHFSRALGQGI